MKYAKNARIPAELIAIGFTAVVVGLLTAMSSWMEPRMATWPTRTTAIPVWERYAAALSLACIQYWPFIAMFVFMVAYLVVCMAMRWRLRKHGGR